MFSLEEKVYLKNIVSNGKKGVSGIVKEVNGDEYKITFFQDGKRRVEMMKEDEFTAWVAKKARKIDDVYFAKTKAGAVIPSKIPENAGYDFYACFDEEELVIPACGIKLIPTGIAWAAPAKYDLNLKNERGSVGTKGLIALAGLIDSGFRNEVFFCVYNSNDVPFVISKSVKEASRTDDYYIYPYNKAIAQGKIEIVPTVNVVEVSYDELLEMKSVRGLGMLGDSGK